MRIQASQRVREGAKALEFLHLAFLQVLATQVDQARYVVKGGANLRLFYDSPRRSQDIDLDIIGSAGWAIEDRVDQVLNGRLFGDLLRLGGITMSVPTKPKQTATTRRWKFTVGVPGGHLNSKIEFSARPNADPEYQLDVLTPSVGRAAGLRAIRVQHYLPPAAIRQKIRALADRSQAEPRDVFDLDLLLARFPDAVGRGDIEEETIERAAAALFGIEYAAFEALVVDYLEDEYVVLYRRREVWEEMVLKVGEVLQGLA
ncbi:MAG TPA: nucleotidyl transferase AbiEii/AbiGii toxin family protein [Patescibacteria group bacterium]|nr:nucleotidyl transferase AbiEii/AbiGii toxin family protein [Patescibacteria group bacterium]